MRAFKRAVIIDIDGTLYDSFPHDDKIIISEIFQNNIFVRLLDKFLWSINGLDFFSNSMRMLNLRLRIYSMLSFKSHYHIKEEYKSKYKKLLAVDLQNKKLLLKMISELYAVILLTSNSYAIEVIYATMNFDVIYAPDLYSRVEQIKEKYFNKRIEFMIGNNFTDDIYITRKSNMKSIYVGQSILKKFFKADYNVTTFGGVLEILRDGS